MRIAHRSVSVFESQKSISALFNRLTSSRKQLFPSARRTIFIVCCIPTACRLSSGYVPLYRSEYHRSASTAFTSIHRTFQSRSTVSTKMVVGEKDAMDDTDMPQTRKRRPATAKKSNDLNESEDRATKDPDETKKRRSTASKSIATADSQDVENGADKNAIEGAPKPKKVKPPAHQVITDRDELPKLWDSEKAAANGSYTFKVASWNVAGLRAVLTKTPNVFVDFVKRHNIDVLCLQETKLQEQHLDDPKLNIKQTMGLCSEYDDYWSCSSAKKGYSGTAVFVRRRKSSGGTTAPTSTVVNSKVNSSKKQTSMLQFVKATSKIDDIEGKNLARSNKDEATHDETLPIDIDQLIPSNISYVMGKEKHDLEGRLIVVDYPLFTLCNVYVPNAGQQLERLSYRVDEWDKDFLNFVHQKRKDRDGVPVVWLGDLNVAHTNLEVWNDGAKHLSKQAGVTAEERASFQEQLDSGHIDAFRYLHPKAAGHYSYWSMRAGNRPVNKGLRLDYFICDQDMFNEKSPVVVRDCYMDATTEGSDHCPVILEMEIKGNVP